MKKLLLKLLILGIAICSSLCVFTGCGESPISFKVNFVFDGEIVKTIDTEGNEKVSLPENPTKDGYVFDGWFWDKDVWEKPFTANSLLNTPLSSDMSVYAKFEHNHKDSDWILISETPATEEAAGKRVYECSVCGKQKEEIISQIVIDTTKAEIVSANGFTFEGNSGTMSVSNDTETYSFINQIQVSNKATWVISKDIYGMQTVATKTIPLNIGNNTVYLLVTSGDGNNINLYTMTVRRRPIYTVTFNTDGGTAVVSQQVEEGGFVEKPTSPTKDGYTFERWSYNFSMPITKNTVIVAQWNCYTLTTSVNDRRAGTITTHHQTKITVGENVTITATTNNGYTWVGWYNGDKELTKELSYTFNMPDENITYTAKWCKVTLAVNNINAGTVTILNGTYFTGEEITITATTNNGYTWVGWYNGDKELTKELSYTFDMPDKNITYTAKWCKVTPAVNDGNAGSVSTLKGKYLVGDSETVTATTNAGYTWVGWYNGEQELTKELSYTFDMPSENTTYVAKWEIAAEMSNFNFASTATTCTITGIKDKTVMEIIVPNYVTTITLGAFSGCSSLQEITIPFVGGSKKTASDTYQYPFGYIFGTDGYTGGTATIQYYYYGSNTSSTTGTRYYIPSSLKNVTVTGGNILYGAFYNCSGLTSITIPDSVTSIGDSAFSYCSGLTSITIPNSVTSIREDVFRGCSGLTEITIPDNVTSIGKYAFESCSSLTSVKIPDNVTSIGEYAFESCSSLTSVTIGNSVTRIRAYAFTGCHHLVEIINKSSLNIIKGSSTYGDIGFYALNVKTSGESEIANKDNYLFYIYNGINYLLGYIGNDSELVVPDNYNGKGYEINKYAFVYCDNLVSVTIGGSVTSIGSYAFADCSNLTSITIPNSVTSIGFDAFRRCSSLSDVTIGNGVTSIGEFTFGECSSLTSITIPDSVTRIGSNAFFACNSLTEITIPDSVTSIGEYAFESCSSLTSITIPDRITSIEHGVLHGCSSLLDVTIGNGVTRIGVRTFAGCSSLMSITFKGTKAAWETIQKCVDWKANVPSSCVIRCTDGVINIT